MTRRALTRVADSAGWLTPMLLLGATGAVLIARRSSFWFDEAFTVEVAQQPLRAIARLVRDTDAGYNSGYYAFVHVVGSWAHAGYSEIAMRGISWASAVLLIPVVYHLASRLFDRQVALVAGLLVATNAFVVEYAVEARMYAPVLLLVSVATYALLEIVEGRGGIVLYVAAAGPAALFQWLSAFVVISHVLAVTLLWRRRLVAWPVVRRVVAVAIASAIPAGAVIAVVQLHGDALRGLSWLKRPGVGDVLTTMDRLAGNRGLLFAALIALACVASLRYGRPTPTGPDNVLDPAIGRTILGVWAVLPIVLSLVLSQVRPMFLDRYLIVVLPAALLLAAAGLVATGKWAPILAAVIVVWSFTGVVAFSDLPPKEDWRHAVAQLSVTARRDDGILVFGYNGRTPLRYYAERDAPELLSEVIDVPFALVPDEGVVQSGLMTHDRVWVIWNAASGGFSNEGATALLDQLGRNGFASVERSDFAGRFGGIRLELFTRERSS